MSSPAHNLSALTAHTFGHHHMEPPPLPLNLQTAGQAVADLAGGAVESGVSAAAGLLMDLDQLVRSIGEW